MRWSGFAGGTIAWLGGGEDERFLSAAAAKANSYLQVRFAAPLWLSLRRSGSMAAILSRPRSWLQCRLLCGLKQFAENRLNRCFPLVVRFRLGRQLEPGLEKPGQGYFRALERLSSPAERHWLEYGQAGKTLSWTLDPPYDRVQNFGKLSS
jgi:hypothetical protein